jgi:hypothetical protein
MTEALKELFDAYKYLPIGVMLFKKQKLFFLNDHLRNVLLLQNLGSDEVIRIIGEMVGLENPSHELLCDFFLHNAHFLYRDKHFQIDRQTHESIDIFVIVRLSDESISVVDQTRSIRQLRDVQTVSNKNISENVQKVLDKALGDWKKNHFPSIVLYKGIPIKADCSIADASDTGIVIRVEKKQLSATQIDTQWLIGNRRDQVVSGTVVKYDLSRSMVWLEDLEILKEGFHLRQMIRYSTSPEDQMKLTINGKKYLSPLHDLSEKGVSIETDNGAFLLALKSIKGKSIDGQLILPNEKIAIKLVWLYTVALDTGTQMKVAFRIGYDLQSGNKLREWLNEKQLELIKEIRNFVQTIPEPRHEDPDWMI